MRSALTALLIEAGLIYIFILAAILECTALVLLPQQWAQANAKAVAGAVFLHAAASLAFIVPVWWRKRYSRSDYYFYLVGLITFFLPGVGLFASMLSLVFSRRLLEPQGLALHFDKRRHLLDESILLENEDDANDILHSELSSELLLDILNGRDMELKRGVIKLLRRSGSPEAVRLLKRRLSDAEEEVRSHAQKALSRIEKQHTKRIEQARAGAKKVSFESLRDLGLAYERYARSELPDQDQRRHSLEIAVQALEQALALRPAELQVAVEIGSLKLELGESREAVSYFARCMDAPRLQLDASIGLCRVYFENREWKALAATTKQMAAMASPDSEDAYKLVLFKFWAEAGDPGA